MRSRTPRPYHHGNLRAALLEQAEHMLRSGRVEELSLRELARRVGVSHGAPRRHFPDKQALLDALAEQGFERLGRRLRDADDPSAPFDVRLIAMARAYVRFATRHAALLAVMFAGKNRAASGAVLAADAAFAVPLGLIDAARSAGEVAFDDGQRTATVVLATLQGLAGLINMGLVDEAAVEELVREAVATLMVGLRPRG